MMRKRFITTGVALIGVALGLVIAGMVLQFQHKPNAEDMYYMALADAILAFVILGACKFSKPKNP